MTPRRAGAALSAALLVLATLTAVVSAPAEAMPTPVTGSVAFEATGPTSGGSSFGDVVAPTDTGGIAVGFYRDVTIEPPTGGRLTPGRINLTPGGAPSEPVVSEGSGCASTTPTVGTSSYLDIKEAIYDVDGHLSSFAADFSLDCGRSVFVRQVRLNSVVPYTAATSWGTQSATFTGTGGTGTATFSNSGTTALHPTGVTLSRFGGPAPAGAVITTDSCSGQEIAPGATCQVVVSTPSPGVDVALVTAEQSALAPARAGLDPAVSAFISVSEWPRPAPVVSALAIPATDGIEVAWNIADGQPWPSFGIDRRTGAGDWVRIAELNGDHYADTTASTTETSTYRVVPESGGGQDLTGAMETGPTTPEIWSAPLGATTVASVDGMGLASAHLSVTSDSLSIAGQPNLGIPGLSLAFPHLGLRVGSQPVDPALPGVAHACWQSPDNPGGCVPITGTITVTRVARQADGTPVELAATVSGTKTVGGVTSQTTALLVMNSVPTGLPAYLVADPGVVTTPVPAGMDQTFPIALRNLGGTAATLASAAVQSSQATLWSLSTRCTGVQIQPGGSCVARVRAVYSGLAYPNAKVVWQGSSTLASVSLFGVWQDYTAPVVSVAGPRVVGATGVITLSASDAQGGPISLSCRLDSGGFVPCSSPWTLTGLKQGTHTVTAYGTDPQGNMSAWVSTHVIADVSGLVTTITSPSAGAVILRSPTMLFWSVSDIGVGADFVQARLRRAMPTTALSGYTVPASTATVRSNGDSFGIAPGQEACWSVRSYDLFHVWSAWSGERCYDRPLDDTALAAAGGFQRQSSSAVYGAVYSRATSTGATLKIAGIRTRQVGVMTYACSTCGSFDVYVGSTWLGRLSAVRSTPGWTTLWLPHQSTERLGTLVLRTTSTRATLVDGVIIRHF